MIWLIFALLAALLTSLNTIFAKIGLRSINSNFATFFRTGIVIICAFVMCLITNSLYEFPSLTLNNWIFLILSGLATGCSWICYFKALKMGDVNKVAPIDKSSFILTSILFLIFFFDDTTKGGNILTIVILIVSLALMFIGTLLMIDKKEKNVNTESRKWLFFAILSAVFASLVSFFVKLGLQGISSNLGTLIRSIIVFFFSFLIVITKKDYKDTTKIESKGWIFLCLSGLTTGGAWLFEYYALNIENSSSLAVNAIGKLAILLTMLFSFVFLKERFTKKSLLGLLLLTSGIILIIIFSL